MKELSGASRTSPRMPLALENQRRLGTTRRVLYRSRPGCALSRLRCVSPQAQEPNQVCRRSMGLRAEVIPPLGNAVRLIDRAQGDPCPV